jgi:hypothetical protein
MNWRIIMETIEDIRREEGNPRAGSPVGGKPRSVFSFFTEQSGARLVAMLLIVLGGVTLIIGSVLFVAPLIIAGLAVVIMAFFGYMWARPKNHIMG